MVLLLPMSTSGYGEYLNFNYVSAKILKNDSLWCHLFEKAKIREALEKYCELDTYAEIVLVEGLS